MLRSSLMVLGLLCAAVLVGLLFVRRVGARGERCEMGARATRGAAPVWAGAAGVLLGEFPLFRLVPWLGAPPSLSWGDAQSHARVAAEISQSWIAEGWIEAYLGGFPFGHHYPPLGWIVLAAEIRAGADPLTAVYLLGFGATLALPLVLYWGLVRGGVLPGFAFCGSLIVCWVSPYNPFVGGYETFFTAGLMSQVFAMPVVTWLVTATLFGERRWEAPLAAWLAMASHPQVTVAALVVLGVASLASGRRRVVERVFWASAVAVLAGAAMYAQGILSLDIPFGWPANMGWRQFGFAPSRLRWWFEEGELFDLDREPVMTALVVAAFLILVLDLKRPSSRAVALAFVATLLLSVSGRWLREQGRIGSLLLSFLQPLRVVSLVVPLAAVVVAVAAQRAGFLLAATGYRALTRHAGVALVLLVAVLSSAGVPSRLKYVGQIAKALHDSEPCAEEAEPLRSSVATLTGGRVWYDAYADTLLRRCVARHGIELASGVAVGTAASVGAHVGVLATAAQHLDARRPGFARRAEALGIGYVLLEREDPSPVEALTVSRQHGPFQLLTQAAAVVGVGCIERRWSGSRDAVRSRLFRELMQPSTADRLLDPGLFTAIDYSSGAVMETSVPHSECDAAGAVVTNVVAGGGTVSATVTSLAPVDVVFRMTAFPTWRVFIDGATASPPTLLAPGFFSVRVPGGRHELSANVELLPHYAVWVGLALAATVALTVLQGRYFSRS